MRIRNFGINLPITNAITAMTVNHINNVGNDREKCLRYFNWVITEDYESGLEKIQYILKHVIQNQILDFDAQFNVEDYWFTVLFSMVDNNGQFAYPTNIVDYKYRLSNLTIIRVKHG